MITTETKMSKYEVVDCDYSKYPPFREEDSLKAKIKDSGERTEFETGAVRDIQEGKGRMDLLPLDVIEELMDHEYESEVPRSIVGKIRLFTETGGRFFIFDAIKQFIKLRGWDFSTAVIELSKHFEEGAKKYGVNNWKKGIPTHSYVDSALRHYFKWLRGDNDEPHDRAVIWNLVCLVWTLENKPDCIDICPRCSNE